jgi:hypothetical protein
VRGIDIMSQTVPVTPHQVTVFVFIYLFSVLTRRKFI